MNAADLRGNTALHLAVASLDLDIMNLLLDAKVDVNAVDKHSRPPLHIAVHPVKYMGSVISGNLPSSDRRRNIKLVNVLFFGKC